jgi:hypothetical protein
MSPEAAPSPLAIVPKELIILSEDRSLQYREIFPIKDREFVN